MTAIEGLLESATETETRIHIAPAAGSGDLGWIVTRHAQLYAQEYGWTEPFEGLCAQIVADFDDNFDPKLRTLLDRRDERRECRLRLAGER